MPIRDSLFNRTWNSPIPTTSQAQNDFCPVLRGVTPYQYVMNCRIERTKKLLTERKLTLTEISLATGFCDQSHFTNAFRRYTTLTPRQYRNQL